METVYIGLGSNLDNPEKQIKKAMAALKTLPDSHYIMDSGLFASRPMGPQDQPDFINAVAAIETQLEPLCLLEHLQAIEISLGKVVKHHWGPRVIDLDILLFGERTIATDKLQVPHPGIKEREFVLLPLQKLCAELIIPGHGKLQTLVEHCPQRGLKYVGVIE